VFARMTITENLQMGAYTRKDKAGIQADIERMFGIFPRLKERRDQLAGTMSGGEQQMLAMARALMASPRCCCWTSRPWACRPSWWTRSSRWCSDVAQGVTIVLVEQNASRALALADRGYVMESGIITMTAAGQTC
jgi:branched-chain amino acid transport system ATP-binding protein